MSDMPARIRLAGMQVNAELRAAGRCWVHQDIPAAYVWHAAIGNQIPLCVECCARWRANAEAGAADPPTKIEELSTG